ncbi:SCAN domain-containing protein 3-like [Lycorma delicatula]|uniref:SCAN domain-containing protein 3-like n=1 Tax=Lycorma delicatula TaxID=130591 RepID=UPI003F51A613
MDDNQLEEKMIFLRFLITDTKRETTFKKLSYFREKNIPFENLMDYATDGVLSMEDSYRGFITHLKNALLKVFCIHCVINHQYMVFKRLSGHLHEVLTVVIKDVNLIKANVLQHHLFHKFCDKNEEGFDHLVLHAEVQRLSKGNCPHCFFIL